MNTLTFEIIKDIAKAKEYWDQFSPHLSIYDEWDFRYCFYQFQNHELFFYVGFLDGKPIGLMPLAKSEKENCLEFFGGDYMEDNKVFLDKKYNEYIPAFYNAITIPAALLDITGTDKFTSELSLEDYSYHADLTNITDQNGFIETYFSGKSKKNLKYDLRKVTDHTIEIISNQFSDLELMFKQNIHVFKHDSWFKEEHMQDMFAKVIQLSYPIYFFTYIVDGQKQGTSLSVQYKNTLLLINYSSDKDQTPNLGKYIILHTIGNALNHGITTFEAGVGDCNWKKHWGLFKKPQYKYYFNFP